MACSIRGTCPSPRLTWKSPSSGDEGLFRGLPYYSTSMSGSKLRILAVRTRRPQLLEADSKTFGLLVDEVTGLIRLADVGVCQAPRGQARPFISGTIDDDGQLVLIADARALAGRL